MTKGELIEVAVKVLATHPMVDAVDLALEQASSVLQPVCVNEVGLHVLADGVVDRVVVKLLANAGVALGFVGHHVAAGRDVGVKFGMQCLGRRVGHYLGPQLALALHDAHDGNLVRTALADRRLLMGMLVLLLAADKGFVGLHHALKRLVKGLGARGVAQAVQQEPRRLLRDLDVLGELSGGDAFGMACHHPDCHEPLAKRQLGVLEDRANLDGEPLAAVAALVGALIREVVNLSAAAVGAICAILPADGAKMVDAHLLVREGFHHLHQAIELLDHGRTLLMQPI